VAAIDAICAQLHTRLNEAGCHGDLARQCARWEERQRVPPADVPGMLQALLDEAWDRTCETLVEIPAPRSDGMRVATVSGAVYNARCDYRSRTIELNIDPVLTRPALRHLAAHEGYPGHYVQFKLRETMVRDGVASADALLSVVNTASSSVFEGIADAGMRMAAWWEEPDDEIQFLLSRHRAAIATRAAWMLHAEQRTSAAVMDWLREASLVGGEGWAANRMRFIVAPARAVLIWSYWHGEPAVSTIWERTPDARRAAFLHFLYGRMHSSQSLALFDGGA